MSQSYPPEFKEQAVQKALTRGDINLKTIAQALGIGYSTLQTWIREYKKVNANTDTQRPQDWTREAQLQALLDTGAMEQEQRSQYCREKGIFPHHLDAWRLSFIASENGVVTPHKAPIKTLKEENASLHKELRRKEKALAEAAALLVLQKKYQALWAERDG